MISNIISPMAHAQPHHLAVVDERGAWTYAELAEAVATAAAFLRQAGLRAGDRLLILGENCRAVVAFLFAAAAERAISVPLNPKLTAREIDDIRAHADARLAIYCVDDARSCSTHAERHAAAIVDVPGLGRIGVASSQPQGDDRADDVALLIYTSGSSGRPKGVQLTHANLLFMAHASGSIRRLTPADRLYVVLPLSHIVALAVLLLGGLMHGATLQLAARFTPRALLDALAADGVTILLATPSLVTLLLDYARDRSPIAAPVLRIVSVSGAPLDATTKAAAEALFGLPLHHGYGITECSPTIAQVRPEEPRHDTSVGRLLPGVQARLMRDGSEVEPGETGELHVRGPNVMRGYFRAPAETAAAIDPDGWFNTGDLARFEGENLFIVGRTKDMVIRFGFNVYPAEVEAAVASHAAVRECAVIGRATGGEDELIAIVQLFAGMSPAPGELMRHAAELLAPYKRPGRIVVMESLPQTASGKPDKQALREWLQSGDSQGIQAAKARTGQASAHALLAAEPGL